MNLQCTPDSPGSRLTHFCDHFLFSDTFKSSLQMASLSYLFQMEDRVRSYFQLCFSYIFMVLNSYLFPSLQSLFILVLQPHSAMLRAYPWRTTRSNIGCQVLNIGHQVRLVPYLLCCHSISDNLLFIIFKYLTGIYVFSRNVD